MAIILLANTCQHNSKLTIDTDADKWVDLGEQLLNKGNAKAEFSKKLIAEALLELLHQQTFESISITDLTRTAKVSRKTFYRNFSSKKEVLAQKTNQISAEYLQLLELAPSLDFLTVVYNVFSTAEKNVDLVKLLVDNQLLSVLTDKMIADVIVLYRTKKAGLFARYGDEVIVNTLSFSLGGFESYLKVWINASPRKSPEQVQQDFVAITRVFTRSLEN